MEKPSCLTKQQSERGLVTCMKVGCLNLWNHYFCSDVASSHQTNLKGFCSLKLKSRLNKKYKLTKHTVI